MKVRRSWGGFDKLMSEGPGEPGLEIELSADCVFIASL
jgi:hypothetical protein